MYKTRELAYVGSGFAGTSEIKTSTAQVNILPTNPDNMPPRLYYKLSFINHEECTISINDSDPIYLAKGQGFEKESIDVPIEKFQIIEANIPYQFIAGH